jgi:division protein CdvB (Snf7/Vps24/ESCRT-III family)
MPIATNVEEKFLTAFCKQEEAKAIAEAQRCAKAGNTAGAKIMAKEVVRIRNAKTNMQRGKSQLSSVSLKTKEMESTVVMAKAMQTGAQAMAKSNAQMNPQQMAAVMREFEKQSQGQEMTSEMLDDIFDDPAVEAEADEHITQIFDELGIEATSGLSKAPTHASRVQQDEVATESDLSKRLAALK